MGIKALSPGERGKRYINVSYKLGFFLVTLG